MFRGVKHIALAVGLALIGAATMATVAQASSAVDLRGAWQVGGPYAQTNTITAMNMATGEFSGTGVASNGTGYTWPTHGVISGYEVTWIFGPYDQLKTYTATCKGTVSSDGKTVTGQCEDTNGLKGAPGSWTMSRTGSTSEEEAAKKAKEKEEAEKAGKHVTGTSIICNYEFATAQNTCVASVGDGSAVSPTTPTGTVTFTTTSGGFTNGAKCTLTVTSGSPTVSNCSLVYQTAESGLPSITATYSGDSTHAPSVGHTQFLGFGINEANFENPTGPSGHYPNEVGIETTVPVSGTTVEATAQGPNGSPGPVPLVFPPLPAGLDAESVTELGLLDGIGKVVNEAGGQSIKDAMTMNADVAKIIEHMNELLKSSSPAEQQQGQILQQDLNKTLEVIDKMLKAQAQNQKEALKNAKGSALLTVAAASKPKRTRSVKAVGYLVKHNLAAGKLKLHLRLGRAALAKLAGKRSRVTLVVRIDMVMPSAVLHAGVPRVLVKRITLKRAPAGHHKKH